jgi:hypothetical protein
MARTSGEITQQERDIYNQFADANLIANYGDQGIRNAEILGMLVIGQDQDITPETLAAAFKQVRHQLTFVTRLQQQADKLVNELGPAELTVLRNWFLRQRLVGVDGSEQGFANLVIILGWIMAHGYPVDARHLDLALTNSMSGRNQLHWKPEPKQKNTLLKNHAADQPAEQPKPDGRKYTKDGRINHAFQSPPEKTDTTPRTIDAWETLSYQLTRNGTHGQQAQLVQVLERARAEGKQWRQVYAEIEHAKKAFENRLVSVR